MTWKHSENVAPLTGAETDQPNGPLGRSRESIGEAALNVTEAMGEIRIRICVCPVPASPISLLRFAHVPY